MPKRGPRHPRPKPPPRQWHRNYIKEWRLYRNLTVEELAAASGMSTGNLSSLENHRQGYSPEGLAKLAAALKVAPATALIDVDPNAGGAEFWTLWGKLSDPDRETLAMMARRLAGPAPAKK